LVRDADDERLRSFERGTRYFDGHAVLLELRGALI